MGRHRHDDRLRAVHLLPGIWNSVRLNTAVTLPIGVEAYALHAWLTASTSVFARTRNFARRSAIGSLLLGMAGQIAYHLQVQAHITQAPWEHSPESGARTHPHTQ